MPERTQVKKPVPHVSQKEAAEIAARDAAEQEAASAAQSTKDSDEATADLMDEIDGLLEENEVLVNYKQRGGE